MLSTHPVFFTIDTLRWRMEPGTTHDVDSLRILRAANPGNCKSGLRKRDGHELYAEVVQPSEVTRSPDVRWRHVFPDAGVGFARGFQKQVRFRGAGHGQPCAQYPKSSPGMGARGG